MAGCCVSHVVSWTSTPCCGGGTVGVDVGDGAARSGGEICTIEKVGDVVVCSVVIFADNGDERHWISDNGGSVGSVGAEDELV